MITPQQLSSTVVFVTILFISFSILTTALPAGTCVNTITPSTCSTFSTPAPKLTTSPSIDIDGNNQLNQGLPADIFHNLGPYSTRYTNVQQTTDDIAVPNGCTIAIANTLERHGARRMTASALKRS
ncbi:hypothetical protein HDU76_007963, partial [Blyttiomyces sp. JEL0837]